MAQAACPQKQVFLTRRAERGHEGHRSRSRSNSCGLRGLALSSVLKILRAMQHPGTGLPKEAAIKPEAPLPDPD